MYIQIGTKEKPANIKVAGGFLAETPIAKITGITLNSNAYQGTPENKFKQPLNDYQKITPTVNVNVSYFKSYDDYLNLESSLVLNINTGAINNESTDLQTSYITLPLVGDFTNDAVYLALKTKLSITQENVKIIAE